jgi:hypothetical protein
LGTDPKHHHTVNSATGKEGGPVAARSPFVPKNFLPEQARVLYSFAMVTKIKPAPLTPLVTAVCLALAAIFGASCQRPAQEAQDSSSGPAPVLATDVAYPGVIFTADPNPVPPGGLKGKTTITWDTGTDAAGEIYIAAGGTEKLFASGRQGSQEAPWIQPGPNEFRFYDADHKLLARLIVTMIIPDSSGRRPAANPTPSPSR